MVLPPVIALAAPFCSAFTPDAIEPAQLESTNRFVRSDQCQSCHEQEFSFWQGSHHQLAMQPANSASVLGDFSGVSVPYFETSATFSKHNEKFIATVENASGELEEFEITHTFGVGRLQQYLVDAPGGRKQALLFAWDARKQDTRDQRWVH